VSEFHERWSGKRPTPGKPKPRTDDVLPAYFRDHQGGIQCQQCQDTGMVSEQKLHNGVTLYFSKRCGCRGQA
jgi:hypothetical protein